MDADNKVLEHYKDVYGLWARGYTHAEIARMLNLERSSVSKKLKRLKQRYPQLFGNGQPSPKVYQYEPHRDDEQIKERF